MTDFPLIKPRVDIVDYGPVMRDESGEVVMTPDEVTYASSLITFKGEGEFNRLVEERRKDPGAFRKSMIKSFGDSAGKGHASLTTNPEIWFNVLDSSKIVDAVFTTDRFGSFLMPSSRRVPIALDQIVVPRGIVNHSREAIELYVRNSEANIRAYGELQAMGLSKQEASKIVQYGHAGGGAFKLPLESLIGFARVFERDPDAIPEEAREIVRQLVDKLPEIGMEVGYFARKLSPRTGCVNPSIFHHRRNAALEYAVQEVGLDDPCLIDLRCGEDGGRDGEIRHWLDWRKRVFSQERGVTELSGRVLDKLAEIVESYNSTFNAKFFGRLPMRVWGEVKRHRTLSQQSESVYSAAARAVEAVGNLGPERGSCWDYDAIVKTLLPVTSIPPMVKANYGLLDIWMDSFIDSIDAYDALDEMGVKTSDAILVVPRGLKLGVLKDYDLYNATTGYLSLRQCATAEPEMQRLSLQEARMIKEHPSVSSEVASLIAPKCAYVGYCIDGKSGGCGAVNRFSPFYDADVHKRILAAKRAEIDVAIGEQNL